jgi:arsenate reductase-like glutaredoxin family protein
MEFLSQHQIPYVEKNIRTDRRALQELIDLGSQGTPTIVVDGEVLIGFDPERLLRLLGQA